MHKEPGIYKITCIANDTFYFGQSVNLNNRFRSHRSSLHRNKHNNPYMQNCYNKYGKDNFKFEVLCYCDVGDLNYLEQALLDKFISNPLCMNTSNDAVAPHRGKKLSIEHKSKISKGVMLKVDSIIESNKRRRGEGKGYYFNKTHNKFLVRRYINGKCKSKWCDTEREAIYWSLKLLEEYNNAN